MNKNQKSKKLSVTNYPVGDFLIRIKNAVMAKNREVVAPETKLIKALALVMKKEGYLEEISSNKGRITARLAYRNKEPVILDLKLVSTPGLRIYMNTDELEKIKGPSISILTTPSGILTLKEAIKKRVGGEVLVEII